MFNMGGPIKQGIMHGIREPYKHGQRVMPTSDGSRPGYAGPLVLAAPAAWTAARAAGMRLVPKALRGIKSLFGKTVPKQAPFSKVTPKTTMVGDDIYKTTMTRGGPGPTKNIFQTTEFQGNPMTRYLAAFTKGPPGGGDPNMKGSGAGGLGGTGDTATNRADFAKSQRDARVQKYMDMMGYDRSKKTALADALIDASKIVSDRGTLDRENITGELINPIIQAASKRLDKPEQIRDD